MTSQHSWLLPTPKSGEPRQLRQKQQEPTEQHETHIMEEMWPKKGNSHKWNRDTSSIIIQFSFFYYFYNFLVILYVLHFRDGIKSWLESLWVVELSHAKIASQTE